MTPCPCDQVIALLDVAARILRDELRSGRRLSEAARLWLLEYERLNVKCPHQPAVATKGRTMGPETKMDFSAVVGEVVLGAQLGAAVLEAAASFLKHFGSIGQNGTNTVAYKLGVLFEHLVALEKATPVTGQHAALTENLSRGP